MSTEQAILGHLKHFTQSTNEPISHAMIAEYLATVLDFKENTIPCENIEELIKTLKHKRVSEEFMIDSLERLIRK